MDPRLLIAPCLLIIGFSVGFMTGAAVAENSHADEMVCWVAPNGYTHCSVNGQGICRTVILYNATDSECVWDV